MSRPTTSTGQELVTLASDDSTHAIGKDGAAVPGAGFIASAKDESGNARPMEVDNNGVLKTRADVVVDVVGVGNIFGYDNHSFGFVTLAGTPEAGNTVTVDVGAIQKVYTVQGGDTLLDIAAGLAALFNADTTFDDDWLASNFDCCFFVRSLRQGQLLDGTALTATTAQGTGSGNLLTATPNDTTLERLFKRILVEVDQQDWRVGRIGVFGEVGTRTRADNPIFLSIRKTLASQSETVFFDKEVTDLTPNPKIDVAFITDVLVGDDQAAELFVYRGLERDRVENYVGDGSTLEFDLDHSCLHDASYVAVTVDGVAQTIGDDFSIEDNAAGDGSKLVFDTPSPGAPPNGDAIVVTYDALERVVDAFVQASASQQVQFGAPIKLEKSEGHFLIASVANKTASAAKVAVNANGFFELERGAIQ
jgi:hypothetical protein